MFPTEQSAQLQREPVTKQSPLCALCSELGCEVRLGAPSSAEDTTDLGASWHPGFDGDASYPVKGRKEPCF